MWGLIVAEKWHNGDKISEHIEELEFEEFDSSTKEKILTEEMKNSQ